MRGVEHYVTVTQVGPGGSPLKPPIKSDRTEPDWELDQARETVGLTATSALVVVTAYWKRPEPSAFH